MKLLLARHAEAVKRGAGIESDEARYLSPSGRALALEAGRALASLGVKLDAALTSPLVRTVQTCELIVAGLAPGLLVQTCGALEPEGSLGAFVDALAALGPDAVVLAVGHEPQMSAWCATLLGTRAPPRAYHPGTLLLLEAEGAIEPANAVATLCFGARGLEKL